MTNVNFFQKLSEIDVSKHIEKKNGFSYLSWPFAISELNKVDPNASWNVVRFDGLPFLKTECGYFVEVEVTVQGITKSQIHPVLDHRNKTIAQPDAFQINTSIQRCIVKAIALHGLGLYVFAGEDLPEQKEPTEEEIDDALDAITITDDLDDLWATVPKSMKIKLRAKFTAKKEQIIKDMNKDQAA
jgi:hypothetical protein